MYARGHIVRPATHAGVYYPRDSLLLANTVERLLRRAGARTDLRAKALIVPHSRLRKSGPVAATAFGALQPVRDAIKRVVIVGPAHFGSFAGIALPRFDGFATPIGELPVDDELADIALSCEGVVRDDLPHVEEHSIEALLPFVQYLFPGVAVLPVAVSRAAAWIVTGLLEAVWGGKETLIIVSTDLSHRLPYDEAVACDRATADAVLTRDAAAILPDAACGFYGLQALLQIAEKRLLRGHLVDLRNSADVTGEESEIVGYGAFVFEEPSPPPERAVTELGDADEGSSDDGGGRLRSPLLRADVVSGRLSPRRWGN